MNWLKKLSALGVFVFLTYVKLFEGFNHMDPLWETNELNYFEVRRVKMILKTVE